MSERMPRGKSYDAVDDQPALAAKFDMEAARVSCRSFDKCHREIRNLLRRVAEITPDFDS